MMDLNCGWLMQVMNHRFTLPEEQKKFHEIEIREDPLPLSQLMLGGTLRRLRVIYLISMVCPKWHQICGVNKTNPHQLTLIHVQMMINAKTAIIILIETPSLLKSL